MKTPFNPNSNRDVFDQFNSLEDIEKEVAYVNGETSKARGVKKRQNYPELMRRKYTEYFATSPKPLNAEEQKVYEKALSDVLAKNAMLKDKLALAENGIADSMQKRGIDFSLVIKKNKKLKRASKRFFGENKSEITFEDYKKALERKKELERYESNSLMEKIED